jgi:hypothetical protein
MCLTYAPKGIIFDTQFCSPINAIREGESGAEKSVYFVG